MFVFVSTASHTQQGQSRSSGLSPVADHPEPWNPGPPRSSMVNSQSCPLSISSSVAVPSSSLLSHSPSQPVSVSATSEERQSEVSAALRVLSSSSSLQSESARVMPLSLMNHRSSSLQVMSLSPFQRPFMENECEALPGVAYPGVRDNRSTLNTKTGYDDDDDDFPGGPGLAGIGMSPFWILLELRMMMEMVGGDNWSYNTCKAPVKLSPPTNQYPMFFTGRMPFLSPKQQCQSCYVE